MNPKTVVASVWLIVQLVHINVHAKEDRYNHPGGIAEISILKESSDLPTVRYGLIEPAILDSGTKWKILIGIDLQRLPGDYLVYIRPNGEDKTARFEKFQVNHKSYLFKSTSSDKPMQLKEFDELSDLGFSNSQPPILPLTLPIEGDWSDEFGSLYPNAGNAETATQNHTYIDSAPRSLIKAPQSGIVCKLHVSENGIAVVVIDHGRGIYSLVHGLSDLAVELGNGVTAGAVIGKVPEKITIKGRQSQSASPDKSRVYWQVKLNDVFINPLLMTEISR